MKTQTAAYIKDYPRPQMVRTSWKNLNGNWKFRFDDYQKGDAEKWYEGFSDEQIICVPFSPETEASGINEKKAHFCLWYARIFELEQELEQDQRLILHFEGCDYKTTVWVNGHCVGEHKGGYARFSFDITDTLKDRNEIVVKSEDSFDPAQLRGKQRWRNESFRCWYVQNTGIWKSVWLEKVNKIHITSIKTVPDIRDKSLDLDFDVSGMREGNGLRAQIRVFFQGRELTMTEIPVDLYHTHTRINIAEISKDTEFEGIHYWTPEHPYLYDMEIALYQNEQQCDQIYSYFGMREICIKDGNILLNQEPLYQRLILDQGYWKNTGLTPPSEHAIKEDIIRTKQLGFNGARKHQKIEDDRYYYWCDVLGLLVWCELPSAYYFGDREVENYVRECVEIVEQHYNHPSVIVWTAFNESWGINEIGSDKKQQHLSEAVYHTIKALDATRPVIANDGWEHTVSDIITLHDYEEDAHAFLQRYENHMEDILEGKIYHNLIKPAFAQGYHYTGQPIMVTEYGGIAFQNNQDGWGYGEKVQSEEEFIKRYDSITTALGSIPWLSGYCYTQLTDVQQEINGLMDENRSFKINPEIICRINRRRFHGRIKREEEG
ncbi:MAG: glycoside hydrolase family 2 protein [Bacteroides sp.]|jgi:beta-galactosidase/beta-glucuronidase